MSLAFARSLDDRDLPALPGAAPFACRDLEPWHGRRFWLPPGDDRLEAMMHGGPAPTPPFQNTVGDLALWASRPEWMDYFDASSPAHDRKLLERDLYLHHWQPWLVGARRILDIGGGIGRFTQWLVARDLEVEILDPDLRSLWTAVWACAGGPGRLDAHWSTGERLPAGPPFDAVIAAEVLSYVEDPVRVVANAMERLKPGGVLLASVEAQHGWAMAPDVAPGTLGALLDGGIVEVAGDRWVRTFSEEEFRALFAGFAEVEVLATHYATGGPFEFAAGAQSLAQLLHWEYRCRTHPLTRPWHRAWTAMARKAW